MANQKLSQLSAATTLSDTDQLYVNDGGTSKSVTYSILRDDVRNDIGSGGKLGIATSRYTSFRIVLTNLSSVIKHHMEHEPDSPATSPLYAACINGPSLSDTTTPNGTDSSTAFAAGAKIGSANTNYLWLDTADLAPQTTGRWSIMATLMRNATGTPLLARAVCI
jgi:hypothetical protein